MNNKTEQQEITQDVQETQEVSETQEVQETQEVSEIQEIKEESIFNRLFKINVNGHVEKKNGLNYLSWAYAWAEVKKIYPNANYKVYESREGCIYHTDGKTCWVKTGVIIEGLEHIEYLPVMDYKNKSISLQAITSFDVNKAIQRSLTKALARHGLGLYIYAGEDLPESMDIEEDTNLINILIKELEKYGDKSESIKSRMLKIYGKDSIYKLSNSQIKEAIKKLKNN